jgi:hypothetical protein
MTIQRPTETRPKRADKSVQTTNQIGRVESNILSGILPSHAWVNDAITKLQRERDLALCRIDKLHDHYKKQLKSQDNNNRTANQWRIDEYKDRLLTASNETNQCKQQLERAQSLIETQNLSIKLIQEELGEEAEFNQDESPQMRSVRRECEKRVNQHSERLFQLQADMDETIAKRDALLEKANKELKDAREEADDVQHGAITMFNEQKRHESHIDRMQDEVHRAKIAVDNLFSISINYSNKRLSTTQC